MPLFKNKIMRDQACKKWLHEDFDNHWDQEYSYKTADKIFKTLTLTIVTVLAGLLFFMGWMSWQH